MVTVKTFLGRNFEKVGPCETETSTYDTDSYAQGTTFDINATDGSLTVYDKSSNRLAGYPPGHWASVVVEPKKD